MKTYTRIIGLVSIFFATLTFSFCLTSCSPQCPPHDYQIESRVEATCIDEGSITYKCTKCGDEYTNSIKAKGHRPGPEATVESPQVCLDCGITLSEKLPLPPVTSVRSLAINHYSGTASAYCKTRIDTQVHSKYSEDKQTYYDSPNQPAKPLDLEVSLPIQEFYTHDIISVYKLATSDGKTFTTPGGFGVNFDIETIKTKSVGSLYAAERGDFLDNYENEDALRIVKLYQSSNSYGGLYEVMDFSDSYIEIRKEGSDSIVKHISLWDDQRSDVRTTVEIYDSNSKLFFEEGTYRILFKYSVAWVTNPTSAVYDKDGNAYYPYGLINDQYDYFYITITNEKDGVLIPDDFGTNDELFYQLRVDTINTDEGELFLPSNGTIKFGEKVKLYVETILDYDDRRYCFDGKKLCEFKLALSYYEYDSDTGIDGTDPYKFFTEINLMEKLQYDEQSEGINFELILQKDPRLRGQSCKMIVTSSFFDELTSKVVTLQQTYIFTFDWE